MDNVQPDAPTREELDAAFRAVRAAVLRLRRVPPHDVDEVVSVSVERARTKFQRSPDGHSRAAFPTFAVSMVSFVVLERARERRHAEFDDNMRLGEFDGEARLDDRRRLRDLMGSESSWEQIRGLARALVGSWPRRPVTSTNLDTTETRSFLRGEGPMPEPPCETRIPTGWDERWDSILSWEEHLKREREKERIGVRRRIVDLRRVDQHRQFLVQTLEVYDVFQLDPDRRDADPLIRLPTPRFADADEIGNARCLLTLREYALVSLALGNKPNKRDRRPTFKMALSEELAAIRKVLVDHLGEARRQGMLSSERLRLKKAAKRSRGPYQKSKKPRCPTT